MTALDPYVDLDFGMPDDPDGPTPLRRRHTAAPIRTRLLTMSQMAALPDPKPLIAGTVDLGTVALLAGYWGTLKSFIALDWAASIATGRRWQGRPTDQRRVLYIAGEGAYGIHGRLAAWETAWQRKIGDEAFTLLPVPVHLLSLEAVAELIGLVQMDDYGVVFIDTISKSIAGADENSAKDMSMVVQSLYQVQHATQGGTVIAVHHTGKDKTTIRGSSALESGVDTVYVTEGSADALTLSRTKRKDGPREDVLNLKFVGVPGTASGVLERPSDLGNSQSEQTLLSHIRSHFSETGATKKELLDTCGLPTSTAYRALNSLVTSGMLINKGTDARPRYYEDAA